jgi:recombinational DNA repair ATPase RecF
MNKKIYLTNLLEYEKDLDQRYNNLLRDLVETKKLLHIVQKELSLIQEIPK